MIINILPGIGNEPAVESGDEILSQNRIRTDDMLNTLSITNKNAATLTENLLKITDKIIDGKGVMSSLLNDSIMSKDLGETMRNLKQTSKETSETVAHLNKIITSLDNKDNIIGLAKDTAVANKLKNIVSNFDNSSNEINKMVANLNSAILNVKDGKGTINYLSNNPELVRKIDATMTNMNEASVKLNENLEALKHNFFFRGYFRRLEKEKAKAADSSKK
jgi:phospholipid/cholesterol/gamma-HCH transport system substrate-binding protein